ncbi:uncharacterized protein C2orf80 homolog [Takifugu rubripes]|uniref:Uncharacterized protein n=1 Tax=Takifugu rubripes TaxID=31033 RepID=A0A674P108_TAKRU|nr:uncharacterized protein C2orf80 homolog [Takifugu rubripes]
MFGFSQAHYDLTVSVALRWLDKDVGWSILDRNISGLSSSPGSATSPKQLEQEAMILSSFAGIIMNRLPVEKIMALYRQKPATSFSSQHSKGVIIHPLTLSYHPFAMLSSYKAVQHSKKQNVRLKQWLSKRAPAKSPSRPITVQSSSSSSSLSNLSDSQVCHEE